MNPVSNNNHLNSDTPLIVGAIVQTYKEVKSQGGSHSAEFKLIDLRLSELEKTMLCQEDLSNFEDRLHSKLNVSIDTKLDKLEDNLKTFIKENVAMKSDVYTLTDKTVDWVKEHSATKADLLKSENSLLVKIVSWISALVIGVVSATAYIIKG